MTPPFLLSTGCAAGRTRADAVLHGLCELVERDAAGLWWRGGMRGRPLAFDDQASGEAAALLAALRRGNESRRTWLLDITTDLGIPAIAAISCHADGKGFACGLGARPTLAGAARGAIMELCQCELAHAVVAAKRAEGGGQTQCPRPGPPRPRHANRCRHVLAPASLGMPAGTKRVQRGPVWQIGWLAARLAVQGIETFVARPDAPRIRDTRRPGRSRRACRSSPRSWRAPASDARSWPPAAATGHRRRAAFLELFPLYVFAVMPEFRVSEISGTQGWIGPWVPALGLTPSAGMTMRQWSLRFDQVGFVFSPRRTG